MKTFLLFTLFSLNLFAVQTQTQPVIPQEEGKLYNEIVKLHEEKPLEALELFKQLEGEYSAAFDYLRAVIYMQQDKPQEAQKNFEAALKKLPTFHDAHLAMVKLLFDNQQSAQALPHLMAIVKLGRADGNTWKSVAQCHLNTKNPEAAWFAIQQARIFLPNDEKLDKVILNIRLEQEKYEEAISLIKAMLDKTPKDRKLWLNLIHACIQSDKEKEALQNLEVFSRLFEMSATEQITLADLYFNAGLHKDAAKHYLGLAEKKDISKSALLRCARGLIAAEQTQKALDILKLKNEKEWTLEHKEQLFILRGEIFRSMDKQDEALTEFNKVLKYNSLNPRALYFIADIHQQNKRFDDALDFYSRAQKDPAYTVASLLNTSRIYLLKKQYRLAEKTAYQATTIDNSPSTKNFYQQVKAFSTKH